MRTRAVVLTLVCAGFVVSAGTGCRPKDPWVLLAQSRLAHEVELRTWVESTGLAEPVDQDASSATPPEPRGAHKDALLSLLIVDTGAPLELPCLTVDVVFESDEGGEPRRLATAVEEIDLSGLSESGGGIDVALRVPMPDRPVSGIGVGLHQVPFDQQSSLCEARAIDQPQR